MGFSASAFTRRCAGVNFMGRKYMGTSRVTFLIWTDRKIQKTWSAVEPEEHSVAVSATVG
jgi:peroxiredoxin